MSAPHPLPRRLAVVALSTFLAGGMLLAPEAHAEESAASGSGHRLSLYVRPGAGVYLSDARTVAGVGGGIGLRDTIRERFIAQLDVSYLLMAGNVGSVRLGLGMQRPGLWSPAAMVVFQGMFGDRFSFLTPQHPVPVRGPALSVGVSVAPARFTVGDTQVSLLELGIGVGSDFPGLGLAYSVGLAEVGLTF
jgi:hypothetical protein